MAEYISREAAIDRLEKLFQLQRTTARHIIEAIPAADVAPVRMGRWKKRSNSCGADDMRFIYSVDCLLCHTTWDAPTNYCPNCGAKMEGDED